MYFERALSWLLVLTAACALVSVAIVSAPEAQRSALGITLGSLLLFFTFISGSRLMASIRTYWNYQLGVKGERMVAEELNQLLRLGWRVFHDVPFDGYNVGHVAIGPQGVFVVETKTRRKWKDRATAHAAHVVAWDGKHFTWPSGAKNGFGLDQALGNAKSVSDYLSKSTGEPVRCHPVLTLPGWFIETTGRGNVIVASTKGLHKLLPKCGSASFSEAEVQQIAFQLEQKCTVAVHP